VADAKETILWRIRHATRDVPQDERPEDVPLERGYRKEDDAAREEIVAPLRRLSNIRVVC
jgi:L-lactate dehydrogenase complex protein LldG